MTRSFRPNLTLFIANFCIMVLELGAGRVIAPYVGDSVIIWSAILAVVLLGIAIGSYLGKWLVEYASSFKLLGIIFLVGFLSALYILTIEYTIILLPAGWGVNLRLFALISTLFFTPAVILGAATPIVTGLTQTKTPLTYIVGAVGSIAGALITALFIIANVTPLVIVTLVAITFITMAGLSLAQRSQLVSDFRDEIAI